MTGATLIIKPTRLILMTIVLVIQPTLEIYPEGFGFRL